MGKSPSAASKQFRRGHSREAGSLASFEEIRLMQQTQLVHAPLHKSVLRGAIAAD
jgi:hypothetical protein